MRRKYWLVLLLLALSALAGYLLSKASWVGRVGISLFYKEYTFLKTWWQGGLIVFTVWMLLLFLQRQAQKKLAAKAATWAHLGAIAAALIGLYFTYQDFRHNTAHRWLGERFHLGGYLFWTGWLLISAFFLTEKRRMHTAASVTGGSGASAK